MFTTIRFGDFYDRQAPPPEYNATQSALRQIFQTIFKGNCLCIYALNANLRVY